MSILLIIHIIDANNNVVAEMSSEEHVCLHISRKYQEGDRILIESSKVPIALSVVVDEKVAPADIWLTKSIMEYPIPIGKEHEAYASEAFLGNEHTICVEIKNKSDWDKYRNVSENSLDRRGDTTFYPHCTATVETRGESVFAARNTIDGIYENTSHGNWPYTSWGDNEDPNAQIMIEFGRKVKVDKVLILLRADFPHDNYWKQASLIFSDGSRKLIYLEKTKENQVFSFSSRTVEWIKLTNLIKSEEESLFPALSQWAIFGGHNDGKDMGI